MRGRRLRLIRLVAFILIIGLALFSPLFSLSSEKAFNVEMNVPPQSARLVSLERPRPEVRIERVLKLDDFIGFDPELASLLKMSRSGRLWDDALAGEHLASLSPEERRERVP